MVNFSFNIVSLMGVLLIVFSVLIIPIRLWLQAPFYWRNGLEYYFQIPIYFFSGLILFFYGWRFDPIMQFSQFFLVLSGIYWVVKDMRVSLKARR